MGKLRKFMIALCIATGISCLAGAAACAANEPEYYVLTAEGAGVDIVFIDNMEGFNNGGKVKEGVNVRFKIEVGANATGEPAVKVNDELLLPDAEGVYSFTMSAATVIKVDNISTLSTLTFDKSQKTTDSSGAEYKTVLRMTYTDLEGKTLYSGMVDGEAKDEDVVMEYDVKAVNGEPFSFKINLSPYYVQEFDVSYNTEVLLPDGSISISALKADRHREFLLWRLLEDSGISAEEFASLCRALEEGRQIAGKRYGPVTGASGRLIVGQAAAPAGVHTEILDRSELKSLKQEKGVLVADADRIPMPLKIRPWRPGDWMVPLGMRGRKKISDMFTDLHVPLTEKERALVLELDGSHVAALVGERIDDSVKVTDATARILRIILE